MHDATDAELLDSLNPAQREAVEHLAGPMLVLAGAGSGKTRVLTLRIARLIEEHRVRADRILAVTFTNKAAGEMKGRVGRLLGRDPAGLWIGTFHSLSARLLRREAEALGFTRNFTIYDEDDRNGLISRILEELGHDRKKFTPRAVASVISAAKNRMQDHDELARSSPFDILAKVSAQVFERLGPALKAANAMDFDDLLLHPVKLFHEHPDRLEFWRHKFDHILVDEFQDTNTAQYRLIRFLGLGHGNVMAVGDDDQSIYGWRGAQVGNMKEFQQDFYGTRVVRLELNYRSTQVVLDAANQVIAQNKGRIGKTLTTTRQGGEMITVLAAADERDEAEWIVRELQARRSDWAYEAMAVLYRTNSQSRAFEEQFRRAAVPYRLIGAISFYDRREVKDLLAYLRLVVNPKDDEAFVRAIGVPKRGIGDASLNAFALVARKWNKSLLEAARTADSIAELRPNVRNGLKAFSELIDRLAQFAQVEAPAPVLERLIETLEYEKLLMEEGPEGADRWENVKELVAGAAEWSEEVPDEEEVGTALERFLEEAALIAAPDKEQGDEEGVTMMTLHTAKGLEWPVVVMAGMEEGLFPLSRAMESPEGIEEERRLAYVGITRSRDKLYVTWARSRRRGGQLMPGVTSRFLEDLPADRVEEKKTSTMFAPFGGRSGGPAAGRSGGWGGGYGGGRSGWGGSDRQQEKKSLGGDDWRPPEWASEERTARPPDRPAAEDEAQTSVPRLVKGERVRHRKFGSGVIQGLTGGGKDLSVTVLFADPEFGTKKLLVAYAGLERDDDWESA